MEHTQFRQLSTTEGRWLMPDPAGMAAADPSNPQSWNRYAYVMNNPVTFTDPLGLYCYFGDGQGFGWGMPRNPTRECHTTDVAGTAESALNGYIDQSHAQDMAAYESCVAFQFRCDGYGRPAAGPGITISVGCGGTFAQIDCDAPGEAVAGSQSISIRTSLGMQHGLGLLAQYQADPMSSSGKDVLQQLSQMSGAAEQFIIVGYGSSVISAAGGAVAADLAAGAEQSVLFGRFSPINGGFSGYLNSNQWLRVGFGWSESEGANVFRITGKLIGGAHWPDWVLPW